MKKTLCGLILALAAMLALSLAVAAIDDYPEAYKSAPKDALVDDWRFYNRECTSFVAWCLNSRNGMDFNNFMGGEQFGNAENWGYAARRLGYTVDMNPAVGSVAWWTGSLGTHVAWVSAVNGSQVTVEEYNYGRDGTYHTRTINANSVSGYIHLSDMVIYVEPPSSAITPVEPVSGSPVLTGDAREITESDATLFVTVTDNAVEEYGVFYGISPSQLEVLAYTTASGDSVTAGFNAKLNDVTLKPSTTYYYLAWASIDGVDYWGALRSFTTKSTVLRVSETIDCTRILRLPMRSLSLYRNAADSSPFTIVSNGPTVISETYALMSDGTVRYQVPVKYNGQEIYAWIEGEADFQITKEHNYGDVQYETAHPHRAYQECACGEIHYTGETRLDPDCRECVQPGMGSGSGITVHFDRQLSYRTGQFVDVATSAWYAGNVADVYELGLMNGTSINTFDPEGDVTIIQAIVMASRIHSIYAEDEETFTTLAGEVWYQPYLDYAYGNGIISRAYYTASGKDLDKEINRAGFAEILAAALPDEALSVMNAVDDDAIPDVGIKDSFAEAVYKLYRAGILTGDTEGKFNPLNNITRAEAAAIISRMAESNNRKSLTLTAS